MDPPKVVQIIKTTSKLKEQTPVQYRGVRIIRKVKYEGQIYSVKGTQNGGAYIKTKWN